MNGSPIKVLWAEDDAADVDLLKSVISKANLKVDLDVVEDGEKVLEYLQKTGEFKKVKTPDLILLDLNLPKVGGREVLQKVKSHPNLKALPVIVFTTSDSEKDILDSYMAGANSYITKPPELKKFMEAAKIIEKFWHSVASLPRRKAAGISLPNSKP